MGRRSRKGRNISGVLLLDKPSGLTSTGALNRVKRILNARRAGHTGSLDPLASGLLPICLGEATKVSAYLLNAEKRYRVWAKLGRSTDTADADGMETGLAPVPDLSPSRINAVLTDFRGSIQQVPPMYSALKHHGRRLYDLAREGRTVERSPRAVTVYELQLLSVETDALELEVLCSKGTYVRTLVEDIAKALGTLGHVSSLRRTGVGCYGVAEMHMVPLSELEASQNPLDYLLPIDTALRNWPELKLTRDLAYYIRQGQAILVPRAPPSGCLRLYEEGGGFMGIGEIIDDGRVAPRRLMHLGNA